MNALPLRFSRAAITGAAGFLGKHLVDTVRASGAEAIPIVRTVKGSGEVAMAALLANPSSLQADVLIHAAAIRHRHGADPRSYVASNVDLVEALMRAAKGRVKRFVFVSSVGVYGFPEDLPISERSPYAPKTLYSQTKIDAEKKVRSLGASLGLETTIVRPTIIYGRGDTNGMLDKLAAMLRARRYLIVGSGENMLHHTHVSDTVRGVLTLAQSEAAKDEHFIVAGPETTTLRRLSELVARAVGRKVPPVRIPLPFARMVAACTDMAAYRGLAFTEREPPINNEKLDVMTRSIAFDGSKAKSAGFAASVTYEQGVRLTLGDG